MTLRLRFFQVTHLKAALCEVLFPKKRERANGGISPFRAMASALGGSVGTANIAGTAGAIALGGAGAVFWMWAAAALGMAVKFAEIVLALLYREKRGGEYRGGPMLYIRRGLGKRKKLACIAPPLAAAFALFTLLASALGTPLVQANTIAESVLGLSKAVPLNIGENPLRAGCALLIALLTGVVILGGAKRIGQISALLVPFMALAYIAACLAVLFRFRSSLPSAFVSIFKGAFCPKSAAGGFSGCAFLTAFRVGSARGVYSNEAGVGSAPIAHAKADTDDPVKQGLYGIFEVFTDTLVMCTLTALAVLSSGVPLTGGGTAIALSAFSSVFGERAAAVFLALSLLLFAYTSIIGWAAYGLDAAKELFGERAGMPYCLFFILLTAAGPFARSAFAWRAGETLNYLMAAPNMAAVLLLSGEVRRETEFYLRYEQKRKGRV